MFIDEVKAVRVDEIKRGMQVPEIAAIWKEFEPVVKAIFRMREELTTWEMRLLLSALEARRCEEPLSEKQQEKLREIYYERGFEKSKREGVVDND